MTEKLSRRAALTRLAALAPATMAPVVPEALGAEPDPFFDALAKYREARKVWDASFDPDGDHPRSGWDDYIGECCDHAHDALLTALKTTPTTDADGRHCSIC
jgi:hypothetical protein